MLSELQKRAAAPLFEIPVPGWLDRPGYERRIAEAGGGTLARGEAQRYYDVDYGYLGQVEWSKTKKGFCWLDAIRVLAAVREGLAPTLHFGFVRYDAAWVQAIVLVPLLDIYRMLALEEIEDTLLAHSELARANAHARSGWPRGHTSLHRTVEDRDLHELARDQSSSFSGAACVQARASFFELAIRRSGAPCTVFDPRDGSWRLEEAAA